MFPVGQETRNNGFGMGWCVETSRPIASLYGTQTEMGNKGGTPGTEISALL